MEGDQPQKSGEVRSMLVAREGAVVRKYSKTLYWFQFMSSVPIVGPLLFSLLIGFTSPYSASVKPRIRELRAGYSRGELTESFWLRNPFNSVHAAALINLAELTSGLCVMTSLELSGNQGIVTKIEAEYFKKAKGTITAICQVEPGHLEVPEDKDEVVVYVATDLFNAQKNLVARVTVAWTIRRRSQKKME